MSNSGGGFLVLGVEDSGARVGLGKSLVREFDPARVNGKIEPRAPGARIEVSYSELSYYSRLYGFVVVAPSDALIVFDRQWGFSPGPGEKQKIVIRPGVLYVRGVGETRPTRQGDLARVVQNLVELGSQKFLARIEKLAAVPLSAELVAYDPVTASQGVRLVARGEGQPVTIVDQQTGAVPIHEVLSSEVPFSSTQAEFTSQLRLWKTSDDKHRVRRETLAAWYLKRRELDLSDDMAEFAFRSAGDHRGFIMFWARAMSTDRLDAVLEDELGRANYPMRQELPWVVASFRWSKRRSLLEPHLDRLCGTRTVAERVIRARKFGRFVRSGRYPGRTFRFGGEVHAMESIASEPSKAAELFETMLAAEREGTLRDRGPGHQLDILLHARQS